MVRRQKSRHGGKKNAKYGNVQRRCLKGATCQTVLAKPKPWRREMQVGKQCWKRALASGARRASKQSETVGRRQVQINKKRAVADHKARPQKERLKVTKKNNTCRYRSLSPKSAVGPWRRNLSKGSRFVAHRSLASGQPQQAVSCSYCC